jgi:hypothetical protein
MLRLGVFYHELLLLGCQEFRRFRCSLPCGREALTSGTPSVIERSKLNCVRYRPCSVNFAISLSCCSNCSLYFAIKFDCSLTSSKTRFSLASRSSFCTKSRFSNGAAVPASIAAEPSEAALPSCALRTLQRETQGTRGTPKCFGHTPRFPRNGCLSSMSYGHCGSYLGLIGKLLRLSVGVSISSLRSKREFISKSKQGELHPMDPS